MAACLEGERDGATGKERKNEHARWKERETEGETKKKLAVGSRDLVWYPTPPCALASTHILATTPLYETTGERTGEESHRGRERGRSGWTEEVVR